MIKVNLEVGKGEPRAGSPDPSSKVTRHCCHLVANINFNSWLLPVSGEGSKAIFFFFFLNYCHSLSPTSRLRSLQGSSS